MIGLADGIAILDLVPVAELSDRGATRQAMQPFGHAFPPKSRGLLRELAAGPCDIKRVSPRWR